MDLYNVAQLRGTCNHVHVLPLRLSGTKSAEDNNPLEEMRDSFATGTYFSRARYHAVRSPR